MYNPKCTIRPRTTTENTRRTQPLPCSTMLVVFVRGWRRFSFFLGRWRWQMSQERSRYERSSSGRGFPSDGKHKRAAITGVPPLPPPPGGVVGCHRWFFSATERIDLICHTARRSPTLRRNSAVQSGTRRGYSGNYGTSRWNLNFRQPRLA